MEGGSNQLRDMEEVNNALLSSFIIIIQLHTNAIILYLISFPFINRSLSNNCIGGNPAANGSQFVSHPSSHRSIAGGGKQPAVAPLIAAPKKRPPDTRGSLGSSANRKSKKPSSIDGVGVSMASGTNISSKKRGQSTAPKRGTYFLCSSHFAKCCIVSYMHLIFLLHLYLLFRSQKEELHRCWFCG